MIKKKKFRIVHVYDPECWGNYYSIEERRRFLGIIPYWGTVFFYKDEESRRWGEREFRCSSVEEAREKLEEYKRTEYKKVIETYYE